MKEKESKHSEADYEKFAEEITTFIKTKMGQFDDDFLRYLYVCEIIRLSSHAFMWEIENRGNALAMVFDLVLKSYAAIVKTK